VVAHPERLPRSTARNATPATQPKKKGLSAGAWEEARALVWKHRSRLALGLLLMVISRLSGLVLPYTTKLLMDNVVIQHDWDLLPKLAMWVGAATLIDAAASFANSQPPSARSPTCARRSKRTSCVCPSATSTRRKAAS
jgi:subfamily B ATP-binding cassette protein MsbA